MLILIAILLLLVPAVVILYPLLSRRYAEAAPDDEGTTISALEARWDAAIAGLRNAELDRVVGTLSEADYAELRGQYVTEASRAIRAMELEEQQEQELLAAITRETRG